MRIWIDVTNSPHVVFFRPLVALLEERGDEVTITARDFAQTLELLDAAGLPYTVVGPPHAGASRAAKVRAMGTRLRALRAFARGRGFDVALSHASHELPLAARSLGVQSAYAFDYEFALAQHGIGCRAATRVVVPEVIPQKRLSRLGARSRKVARYAGLKEEYYLHGFAPDPGVLDAIGIDRSRVIVVVRTPPEVSLYHRHGNPLFVDVLERLGRDPSVHAVVLPRTPGAARGDRGTRAALSGRAGARGRRPQPRRARRRRRVSRRDDEPRGGGARNSGLHDVLGTPRRSGRDLVARGRLRVLGRAARPPGGAPHSRPPADDARPRATARRDVWCCSSGEIRSAPSQKGRTMRRSRVLLVASGLAALTLAAVSAALAGDNTSGFTTSRPAMLTPVRAGVTVSPMITVGDTLNNGYRFEAIPDGIAVGTRGQGRVDLYVNHETSKTPFPYNRATPTAANSENDFDNAQVSHLILNQHSGGVLNGSFAIGSSLGYQRFCSNYLATAREGFSRPVLFTNEETPDWVFRREASWPPPIGDPNEAEGGLVVALDTQTGKRYEIPGMGRHNHENSVPVPGYDDLVVLSGDDTFTSGPLTGVTLPAGVTVPAQSQLYSYIAHDTDESARRRR